jgi:hypothetical protein
VDITRKLGPDAVFDAERERICSTAERWNNKSTGLGRSI